MADDIKVPSAPAILGDPQPKTSLEVQDFDAQGVTDDEAADCALVTQTRRASDDYLTNEKWKTSWGDNNTLYNSPRPLTVYNGTYVLEPDVQRFTMAQDENAIVPQLTSGLFYQDPFFMVKGTTATKQKYAEAKRHLMMHFLTEMNFQRECEWAVETMVHQGTTICEWGINYKPRMVSKRKSGKVTVPSGVNTTESKYSSDKPEIDEHQEGMEVCFTFERAPLTEVFGDPKLCEPDIRESGAVVRSRSVDFYDLQRLRNDPSYTGIPKDEELKSWFLPGVLPVIEQSQIAQQTVKREIVVAGQNPTVQDPNPLRKKLRLDVYWDANVTISVVAEKHRIRKMKNPFNQPHTFLSANYWNCPNSMYGMGVGRLAGSDQRIEAGSVGTALKILAYKANAPYMRSADSNMPSQMQMTGLGRVITVSDLKNGGYQIMPTPDVPRDLFTVLADARMAREAATGADSMLVGGSSAGGKMSTKATGAVNTVASAGATKLGGPLGHFINQIFIPFLRILDELIYRYVPDAQIVEILGDKLGEDFLKDFDIDKFHEFNCDFDVLAGAKLSAREAQAQALVLLFQFLENPQVIQNYATINKEKINLKPLFSAGFAAFQFPSAIENDIFEPMSAEEIKQQQGLAGGNKLHDQLTTNNQKFQQKQALEDQANNNRITRDIVRDAFKKAGLGAIETGDASGGFEDQ